MEKYLRSKFKAHFTEDGMKHWSEEAAKAWKCLDARRKHMGCGFRATSARFAHGCAARHDPGKGRIVGKIPSLLPDP